MMWGLTLPSISILRRSTASSRSPPSSIFKYVSIMVSRLALTSISNVTLTSSLFHFLKTSSYTARVFSPPLSLATSASILKAVSMATTASNILPTWYRLFDKPNHMVGSLMLALQRLKALLNKSTANPKCPARSQRWAYFCQVAPLVSQSLTVSL